MFVKPLLKFPFEKACSASWFLSYICYTDIPCRLTASTQPFKLTPDSRNAAQLPVLSESPTLWSKDGRSSEVLWSV